MKKLIVLLLLLFILTVGVQPAAAIVYGDLDGKAHPNVGMISVFAAGKQQPLCSGTLIQPRVFLTAGHCTDFLEKAITAGQLKLDNVKVSFDKDDALANKLLKVSDVITHPEYDNFRPQSNPHDVGLLILEKEVKNIPIAALPAPGFLDVLQAQGKLRQGSKGAKFTVVGYGATLNFPPPEIVRPDGKRRVAQSEFQALHESNFILSQNQATDNAGICNADSGGPALWSENGAETLVGIISAGDDKCVAIGVYYRADTADTLDFINGIVSDLK